MSSIPVEKKHKSLQKKLRVIDIWALGVGIVVSGQYFGWNLGLNGNGPVAMLIASMIICLLFLGWVLTLAELSVAMPHADGPLAYGERTGGPWLGFTMAWSMLLECLFGMIATALATGWYMALLANPENPQDEPVLIILSGLTTVAVFFVLHVWGVKEQSVVLVLMTYAALLGLLLFWGISAADFSAERIWAVPVLGDKGWRGVLDAAPFALWWLINIEGAALASEETAVPFQTIPRGLVLSMLTIITSIGLTLLLGCGSMPWQDIVGDYPLAKVVLHALDGRYPFLWHLFCGIALFGLIASYHGLLYSTSRQLFSLGRAGYLPAVLGKAHASRGTPVVSLFACSLVAGCFVIASVWFKEAIELAILVAGLASLVWYILAMFCLWTLRRRSPHLFSHYRAPLARTLPIVVVGFSGFVLLGYIGKSNAIEIFLIAAVLYLAGLMCFFVWGRRQIRENDSMAMDGSSPALAMPPPGRESVLEWFTAPVLWLTLLVPGWIIVASFWPQLPRLSSDEVEAVIVLTLIGLSLGLVCLVAWLHTQPRQVTKTILSPAESHRENTV